MDQKVTVIVPAYNEESTVQQLLHKLTKLSKSQNIEIIVVDDGSTDATAALVSGFSQVKLIKHPYNKGYGAAIKTGLQAATGEVIVTVDADMPDASQYISPLLEMLNNYNYDAVIGDRCLKVGFSVRSLGRWVVKKFASYLAARKIVDLNCGLRAFKKNIVMQFMKILPNGFSFSATLTLSFLMDGYSVGYLPIKDLQHNTQTSKVKLSDGFNALLLILRIMMVFSPLRVFVPISIALVLVGLPLLVGNLLRGNITDVTLLILLSSLLIFCFGLLADQLAALRRSIT